MLNKFKSVFDIHVLHNRFIEIKLICKFRKLE